MWQAQVENYRQCTKKTNNVEYYLELNVGFGWVIVFDIIFGWEIVCDIIFEIRACVSNIVETKDLTEHRLHAAA